MIKEIIKVMGAVGYSYDEYDPGIEMGSCSESYVFKQHHKDWDEDWIGVIDIYRFNDDQEYYFDAYMDEDDDYTTQSVNESTLRAVLRVIDILKGDTK